MNGVRLKKSMQLGATPMNGSQIGIPIECLHDWSSLNTVFSGNAVGHFFRSDGAQKKSCFTTEIQRWVTREVKTKAKENNRKRPSLVPRRNENGEGKRRISKYSLLGAVKFHDPGNAIERAKVIEPENRQPNRASQRLRAPFGWERWNGWTSSSRKKARSG
jgi:hypothetical protein